MERPNPRYRPRTPSAARIFLNASAPPRYRQVAEVWTISRWLTTSTGVHTTCAATAAETPAAAEAAADAAGSETPSRTAADPTELLVASSAAMPSRRRIAAAVAVAAAGGGATCRCVLTTTAGYSAADTPEKSAAPRTKNRDLSSISQFTSAGSRRISSAAAAAAEAPLSSSMSTALKLIFSSTAASYQQPSPNNTETQSNPAAKQLKQAPDEPPSIPYRSILQPPTAASPCGEHTHTAIASREIGALRILETKKKKKKVM
nr:unnamed protein product [Digitaria exilis]